jgi:hypothetical protein
MIKLNADQYCIEIDTTHNGWCSCWLIIDENKTYLGAESLKYLKDHLLAGLDDSPKEVSGHLYKYDFSWVLSLEEMHSALYIAKDGLGKVLLVQNAGGHTNEICLIKLSQERCLHWISQIQLI